MFLFLLRSDGGQTVVAEIDHPVSKQTENFNNMQLIIKIEYILNNYDPITLGTVEQE